MLDHKDRVFINILKSLNPVILPDSSYHDLSSTLNSQLYRIFVGGVHPLYSDNSKRTLIIVLDGNWLFASVYEYLRILSIFDRSIENPIVVGIGYPTEDINLLLRYRERDLAPQKSNLHNVEQFLLFIYRDVLTFLQNEIGITSSKKILSGHSWGGAFSLYTMVSGNSMFDGYLASSPIIIGTAMEDIEQKIQNFPVKKETKIFFSLGSDESLQFADISLGCSKLRMALEQYAPENLRYRHFKFENESHSSVTLAALTKGLRYLLT